MAPTRRSFLTTAGSLTVLASCAGSSRGVARAEPGEEEEVTPAEDLMREHGVLRRVMYLYDEAARRLEGKAEVPLDAVLACAGIIRHVIEDYHEKIEQDFVFPRFEKAGTLVDLTKILREQHAVGRALTDQIVQLAKAPLAEADRAALARVLRRFGLMYQPHAAREDTVLFPAFRGLVGAKAYAELGEQFEDREKQILGDHGFERAVEDVAKLERAFGFDDLAHPFTL